MAKPHSLPLYVTVSRTSYEQRILDVVIFLLLLILVSYRLLHIASHGASLPWVVACFSELCFTFLWILVVNCRWSPVEHIPFSDRLEQRVSQRELPPVDLLVTTADPVLEPPIITINTVLSLLAVDYPADKLACYVSDDGSSALTYFSLLEASKFAKTWIPFCRKYNVQVRAPFWYFSNEPDRSDSPDTIEFRQDWNFMKREYEKLNKMIEDASRQNFPSGLTSDFALLSGTERRDHPTVIKVIWENREGLSDGIPHLVYVSRERRPKHPHHNKAGAMNVLTRVSGVMTNAPFMLNVDCDMSVNNPDVVRQAMCFFIGAEKESDCAFIQFPQRFHGIPQSQMKLQEIMWHGIAGIQGPFYCGTGCFHRRRVIYGLSPEDVENEATLSSSSKGILAEFGSSEELVRSGSEALQNKAYHRLEISSCIEAAYQVASCIYDNGTGWGTRFGWLYAEKMVDDVNISVKIQSKGWKTLLNSPAQPAFLGDAPPLGPAAMVQQRRWATGLLEALVGRNSPILGTLYGKLRFRQCLAYLWILVWGLRSVPELCYTLLPAYCTITNSYFLPTDPFVCIPLLLFLLWSLQTLSEYSRYGLPIGVWWAAQCINRITATGPWLLSILDITLKLLGISEAVFKITKKTIPSSNTEISTLPHSDRFMFDDSPSFIPGLTILLVHMAGLVTLALELFRPPRSGSGAGLGEALASVWVVMSYRVFLRGLFERGELGIPTSTILKSSLLGFIFVHLSRTAAAPA